jgi:zinc D-Ala-D-Ala carboxypeptidase
VNLSPNFTLAELTRSQAAARHGIDNSPPPAVLQALRTLCTEVLEPLRARIGGPLVINSGYRGPALNRRIGGAATSQHVLGEAVDIERPGLSNRALAQAIIDARIPFDQLILEAWHPAVPGSGWVHVSYRGGRLRGQVLTATVRPGGRMIYSEGLAA